jgi:hypothetical protein
MVTLDGTLSYLGDTIIEDGSLRFSSASLADGSSVRLSGSAMINLTHALEDTIKFLRVNGLQMPAGTYSALNISMITGTGSLGVTEGNSLYVGWLAAEGLEPSGPKSSFHESADGSGVSNPIQSALGGSPGDPARNGIYFPRVHDVDGSTQLVLTIAVRHGAVFNQAASASASIDGITYKIEGSRSFSEWGAEVEEVQTENHEVSIIPLTGYSLRSFRLLPAGDVPLNGFFRVVVNVAED